MTSTKRALALTFGTQYLNTLVFFATTVIVSRLLTPEEIGIYSIALAFVAFGHLLRDFGSGQYVIQEPELTTDRIRAALTVTFLLGWSVAIITYVGAPYIGDFYQDEGVANVLRLLALNFLLLPLGSVPMACLQRDMNFGPSVIAKTTSTLAQCVVSITLAYLGYSYIGLAWGNIAGTLVFILVAVYYRPKGFPKLPGLRELRRVFSFGGKMSLNSVLTQLGTAAPELIVGRMLGMAPVGLMSRGLGVVSTFSTLVMNGINPVIIPLFAKIRREDGLLSDTYIHGTNLLSAVGWTFFGCMAVLAPELILTLFGEQWGRAAFLVQVYSVGQFSYIFFALAQQLFVATGRVGDMVRIRAMILPVRLVMIAIGALHSIEMVAILSLLCNPYSFWIFWRKVRLILAVPLIEVIARLSRSALLALITVAVTLATKLILVEYGPQSDFLVLLVCFIAGSCTWLVATFKLRHPIADEITKAYHTARERFA